MTTTTSSQDLMRQVAEGNRDAFTELHDRFKGMVRAAAARVLGRSAEVDDVCQEVFCSLWRDAARYDPTRGSPSTWIGLLVRRRAVDCLRSRIHQGAKCREYEDEACSSLPFRRDANESEAIESAGRVRDVIAQLPDDQRAAVALSFAAGIKGRHIASVLRVPHATVKTRIRRGIQRMRFMMQDDADAA